MDTMESTFVQLKFEGKEWIKLLDIMAQYKLATGAETTNQGIQIVTDDLMGFLSNKETQTSLQGALVSSHTQVQATDFFESGAVSDGSAQTNHADFLLPVKHDQSTSYDTSLMAKKFKAEKAIDVNAIQAEEKTVKPAMRNVGVNLNMNVVRPIQRTGDCKEVKRKEAKLDCQNGSTIKRVTLEDYKERRRASFDGKKHCEEKGSQTDDHHRLLFKKQLDFLECHLKRLKNLVTRILHERPTKYLGLASEYVTHITDITRQLTSEDLALVMARDEEEENKMKENRFWKWTSEEDPSERIRNGNAGRNDQLEFGADTHNARLTVSCSVGGREVTTRTDESFDPLPFDEGRDTAYDDDYHRDNDSTSNESQLRKRTGNFLFRPDRNRVEYNARGDYSSRRPFHHEETAPSNRASGEPNCDDMSEIPAYETRQECAQYNYQEHEPIAKVHNSPEDERNRCAPSAPRRPRDRHRDHQYLSDERAQRLNAQRVSFGSASPIPVKDDRSASPPRVREERESNRRAAKRLRGLFDCGGDRPRDRNDQDGYRRDGHKAHHSRVDSMGNDETGDNRRNSSSLEQVSTSIRHTRKPLLFQEEYSPREVARWCSRSPLSKAPRQGRSQRNHPALEHHFKRATPTKFRNRGDFEAPGKRKWPSRDPLLQRAPRNQPREKDRSSTARLRNEASNFGLESALFGDQRDSPEEWQRGEKRQDGCYDQSTDLGPFPL